ncbi:MAG: caspase family protein [Bacteroidia bacterium]|nr:caspase family protein [Bacteroidia bacterium]
MFIVSSLVRIGKLDKAKEFADKFIATNGLSVEGDKWNFYRNYITVISEHLPNRQYEQALVSLNKAILDYASDGSAEVDSKSEYIDVLSLKGYVLEKLGRLKEARDAYEQSLVIHSLQPDVKEALSGLQKKSSAIASNDKLPPEILLISPKATRGLQVVAANKTEIIGKAKDPAGISSVTINGKLITKVEEDGLFSAIITLKEGDNNLLITAIDNKGNSSSKTFSINANVASGAAVKKQQEEIIVPVTSDNRAPVYHAMLIAAKDYEDADIPDLQNPQKDAEELRLILEKNYTFSTDNIQTLYNKSREEIMQALVAKCNSLTENDNLLIFYAGHGIAEKDKFGDVDGYWIPSSAKKGLNASYISSDDINKALKRSNSKHILVIADACFSGAFTRELPADASVGVQKQYSVPSRKIMASGNMEPVPDNSRFIFYLKKNLKENREKYLTSKKLFDSFYEAILNNSDTSPQYAAIKNVGDEGGEFVFIKK